MFDTHHHFTRAFRARCLQIAKKNHRSPSCGMVLTVFGVSRVCMWWFRLVETTCTHDESFRCVIAVANIQDKRAAHFKSSVCDLQRDCIAYLFSHCFFSTKGAVDSEQIIKSPLQLTAIPDTPGRSSSPQCPSRTRTRHSSSFPAVQHQTPRT